MRKKVKGVAFNSYPVVGHDDGIGRPRFKRQTLLELEKETEAARTKLETMKLKKLTLQAEVGFLRRRHEFLSENQSSTNPRPRKSKIEKKEAVLRNIISSEVVDLSEETKTTIKTRVATFDLNQISREELEEGENSVRSVIDENLNGLKLSMCRNMVGDVKVKPSQARKRKISCQDPVALRV